MKIDERRFQSAHEQFEKYILQGSRRQLTSFGNPFLRRDEIEAPFLTRPRWRR